MFGTRWLIDPRRRKVSLVATTLSAVSLCAMGIPVLPYMPKDLSTPFPCQSHPCGCPNADYCWRYCGCHTVAEKLSWAKMHNVTPPEHYLDRVNARGEWAASDRHDRSNKELCRSCSQADSHADSNPLNQATATYRCAKRLAILVSAYRTCRGIAGAFGISCPIICEPLPEPWHPEDADPGHVAIAERVIPSVTHSPPSPPPRSPISS
jgi:hypothetical protein